MSAIPKEKRIFSNKAVFTLIMPLVIEQLLVIVVGLSDTIMISSVSESAVSGVSLVDSVMTLILQIFAALATGGAVVAGQFLGKKDGKKAREAAEELVWFMGIVATGITVLLYVLKPFIFGVVFGKITPEVHGHAETYMNIVNLSVPFIAIYNAGAAIFRTMGNSRITMTVSIIMNLINVAGNALCIYGLGMQADGAAFPTLISRMTAAIVIILLLTSQKNDCELYLRKSFRHRFSKEYISRIMRIGIPNGVENGLFQLGKIMLVSLVSTFGTSSITAYSVTNVIISFQVVPGTAIGHAVTPIVSRCVGAGDYDQARFYIRRLITMSYISLWVFNLTILACLNPILSLYNLSAETAALATNMTICHTIGCLIIWPFSFNMPTAFRAAGDARFAMVVSIASMAVFRIMSAYILATVFGLGALGVWIAMPIDWFARSACFITHYLRGKWTKYSM